MNALPSDPAAAKRALRTEVRAALRALPAEAHAARSAQLREMLAPHLTHGWVLAYAPMPEEVDLWPTLAHLGARLVLPRIDGVALHLHAVPDLSTLVRNRFGILEPPPDAPLVAPADITTVLVPGLAFTPTGDRLGRGAGMYDRLLAALSARRVAVAFTEQLRDTLPTEPHDQRCDVVLVA